MAFGQPPKPDPAFDIGRHGKPERKNLRGNWYPVYQWRNAFGRMA